MWDRISKQRVVLFQAIFRVEINSPSFSVHFRHVLWSYRNAHRGTKVGEPPPDGYTGFNSGVKLVDLAEMRKSVLYNQLLQAENITRVANKYSFKGHLGDQDFYTVISFDYPQLFYTLPCQWNRQLCTWWKNNGYQEVFDLYHKCEPPYHVLHGNCNTPIPAEWSKGSGSSGLSDVFD